MAPLRKTDGTLDLAIANLVKQGMQDRSRKQVPFGQAPLIEKDASEGDVDEDMVEESGSDKANDESESIALASARPSRSGAQGQDMKERTASNESEDEGESITVAPAPAARSYEEGNVFAKQEDLPAKNTTSTFDLEEDSITVASAPPSQPPLDTPTKTTPSKRSTPTSKSKSRSSKRKSGYADDSDSEYRVPKSLKSKPKPNSLPWDDTPPKRLSKNHPDADYTSPSRKPPKAKKPRKKRFSMKDWKSDEEEEDASICLESCVREEEREMMVCDGERCGRKFHLGCVGFRAKPEGRLWFCFGCRKVEGKGMRSNGVVEVDDEDEDLY